MACDLYCCRFGRFPRVVLIATLKQGKLQDFFRAGLNEIQYDYVDSKQHFYLQYPVAATYMKALRKKTNDT